MHYFAMQLIEGCSLAQVIEQLRQGADVGFDTPAKSSATATKANDPIVASAPAPARPGLRLQLSAGSPDPADADSGAGSG